MFIPLNLWSHFPIKCRFTSALQYFLRWERNLQNFMYEVIRESHKLIEENNEYNATENSLEYIDQIVTD